MTAKTAHPRKVILVEYRRTDTEIDRVQVVGLDGEDPLLQVVRRWWDDTGTLQETVTDWAGRERLEKMFEDPSVDTEVKRALRIREAVRLMEEAAQVREAAQAEAARSDELSAAPPCDDGTEPSGPDPAQPVTPGAGGRDDLRAVLLLQEKEEEEKKKKERRDRAACFVARAGDRIIRERPQGVLPGEWYQMLFEELGWEGWWEAHEDPRIQRGDLDHVWEAVERAKTKADVAQAAAHDPHLFGISIEVEVAGNYPTSTPTPVRGSFEQRFAIRCPMEVPEDEWRQRILERLGCPDWGPVYAAAEQCVGGPPALQGKISRIQGHLYMEMQERKREQ